MLSWSAARESLMRIAVVVVSVDVFLLMVCFCFSFSFRFAFSLLRPSIDDDDRSMTSRTLARSLAHTPLLLLLLHHVIGRSTSRDGVTCYNCG